MNAQPQCELAFETLLPPNNDTDALVSVYLDQLEQLHRIVHIPSFRKEYANFWVAGRARPPAMTVLVLAMISMSACSSINSSSISNRYRTMAPQWIFACDEWLKQQSTKHRKLVHYQISCLVFLSKRMNMIGKKRYWKETGSLIQDAIIDGLHYEAALAADSPYMREMKRRIFSTLRELDLRNSFESGLPSLLHNVPSIIGPPSNIHDEDFDETSKKLPEAKPLSEYTFSSYQALSARSWPLRLEISQRLFSTRFSKPLDYDEVLRYTHEVTQAIDAIPLKNTGITEEDDGARGSAVSYAYLHFQLKECILALHRPYLKRNDSKFWLSETVYSQAARDIIHLDTKLEGLGSRYLTALTEDLMLASLSLFRISVLQSKGQYNLFPFGVKDAALKNELFLSS